MIKKKTLGIALAGLTTLTVIAAGCGSPSTEPTTQSSGGQLTAQEIATNSVTAYTKLTTVKMDMDMTLDLETVGGSQPMKIDMVADATGSINVPAKEMQLTMSADMDMPVLGKQKVSTDMYMVGGWIYQKAGIPGLGDQWMKTKLDDNLWQQQNQLAQQIEFLKSAIEVNSLGEETVDGVACYVLQIKPDMAALAGWVKGQVPQQSGADVLNKVDFAKMFKSFSIKEWIAKKDFMVVKGDMAMAVEMSAADLGAGAGDIDRMTMDIKAVVKYSDFNKPITITLPPEVAGAKELPTAP